MCTAVSYLAREHYFGRNLDLEYGYREAVTVTPRNFPLHFRKMGTVQSHYAMIGMAYVSQGYPLYYDATNEKGLSVAGLNFPGNAYYMPFCPEKDNISPFELIPWILCQCATVDEAQSLLEGINLFDEPFSPELPLSPLHWILSDRHRCLTLEAVGSGVRIYENPVGILTNNPPFPQHLTHLRSFLGLTPREPTNTFAPGLELTPYSRGMGALGLPGDASSMSRFVRAAFVSHNSKAAATEEENVSQFFHILRSVEMPRGCVELSPGVYEITRYSSCCNTARGIYYYTTYDCSTIHAVDLHREDLNRDDLISYPLITKGEFRFQNR